MCRKYGSVGADRPKGLSDIVGYTTDGRFFAIELKSKNGRATPEQEEFITRARSFAARAGIARTLDEIDAILDQ